MARPVLEVCIESISGVVAARDGGADRVELCDNLADGGTTPSLGTIAAALDAGGIDVMVMVRPRGGDFLYSDLEFDVMQRDVASAHDLGARGVVFGLLSGDGAVDRDRTARLVELARPLEVTFHRAFDMSRDPFEALETLIELGIDRILTSGQKPTAPEGAPLIRRLVETAAGRIAVMPGCGIREHNIRRVLDETRATEAHFSAGSVVPSRMEFRNPSCAMGGGDSSEYEMKLTDVERVRAYVAAANSG